MHPKNTKIAFLGEGGDDDNVYVKGSESEYIHNKLKDYYPDFINDSWDGKDLNVMNDGFNIGQTRFYLHYRLVVKLELDTRQNFPLIFLFVACFQKCFAV